ncbi:MAG: MFS transporter [Thermoplasmataceae archaeon]
MTQKETIAEAFLTPEQKSSYRWVMATISGIVMTTSFISLSAFSIVAPSIAQSMSVNSNTLTVYGVDAFSIGLFIAFFIGHGGIFDTRIGTGVIVAQVCLIVPEFLIPSSVNIYMITALRFFQGFMIMMLALFSIQLSGWFRSSERGRSLSFTLGAITLGSAAGGILSGVFSSMSWQITYYITGVVMIAGAAVYFSLARSSKSQLDLIKKAKSVKHQGAWKNPMTWIMGIIQVPVTWVLFSLGGYMSTFSEHLGYTTSQATEIVIIWGLVGFAAAFAGGILGDRWAGLGNSNRQIFNSRLRIMTIADMFMGAGALLMVTVGGISFYWLVLAVSFSALLMMFPPNYWASAGNVFPVAILGSGAFGMGLISNSADAIGPLVSSFLVPDFGWSGVFALMFIISLFGVLLNLVISRARFDIAPD